ncbi:MAG: OsmC family protein [Chloroflexota bacterium]|nr:OsmC family protein [Dehalococcoidia bacterium]MDW8252462.1 OsmC family protein [Chloroflexota bacterium]
MGTQRLIWRDGVRFTGIDSWGHTVEIGGDEQGSGLKPSDLVPLALAACTAYDVVTILTKQRQQLRGFEAQIETTQDDQPPWAFRRIAVHFTLRGAVDPKKAAKAIALAERSYCSVAATLRPTVELAFTFEVTA